MKKLLLLHGAIGSKEQIKLLADSLNDVYEVHTMNFLGHGGTEFPEQFSIQLFAEQVNSFIDQHKLAPINIFGYSMGGYVALYLAALHPQKIQSIFTLGTKFDWTLESAQKETARLIPEKIEEKLPSFAKILAERHAPQDWKQNLKLTGEMMIRMGIDNPLTSELLRKITIPVFIAWGAKDNMVTLKETVYADASLKNSQMMIMKDVPHPIEQVNVGILKMQLISFFA